MIPEVYLCVKERVLECCPNCKNARWCGLMMITTGSDVDVDECLLEDATCGEMVGHFKI